MEENRSVTAARTPTRPGRKLDHSRDAAILDAALTVLAECGYEGMTIDMVAARAGAARATVYRRWAAKADIALAAVAKMSEADAGLGQLPDTGSLRGDLIATIRPHSAAEQELRVKVMTGLQTAAATDPRIAQALAGTGAGPWIEAGRVLLQRAVDRSEYPAADIATLAQVIPLMCICRVAVQQQPITCEFALALIDGVIIPALRGSSPPASPAR